MENDEILRLLKVINELQTEMKFLTKQNSLLKNQINENLDESSSMESTLNEENTKLVKLVYQLKMDNKNLCKEIYDLKLDSIPTSCVQLAKDQIIKYSDPKYNINDLKTGDCETMLLNQTIYYLNKSESKWISVELYYPFELASFVKIFGRSKQYVIFKEEEWIQFHEQRENINKYFQTFDTMWKPRQIGSKTSTFEMIEEKKILKIEDMSGNEVYLEFDADHEAIYGMERYYTVQQCEELRDKYKIRRKVCRKFLQGKTCSQCLVKRISEIGLRHFLDTVNKHIKDCSDSSSSSDEEVFKAVEQNGEETTEEEEE
ncbi:hypothetical protein FQA39_LY14315 [Lamprigera yunnana]|nr:hypothetical protein FQA39_LY14315 [Lamprigera yunnana]